VPQANKHAAGSDLYMGISPLRRAELSYWQWPQLGYELNNFDFVDYATLLDEVG
jgi:hypothetical protein